MPLQIQIEGKNYLDGVDIDTETFYKKMMNSKEFFKTSQPSPQEFLDIFEKVKEVIMEQLNAEDDAIKLETSFIDDLGADSLDIFQIIMGLEEEFDIEIPDADAEKVTTVGDVVDYIKENV